MHPRTLCVVIALTAVHIRSASAQAATPRIFTFSDPSVLYSAGDWRGTADGNGGFSLVKGASVVFTFTGTSVRIIGAKNARGANWIVGVDELPTVTGNSRASSSSKVLDQLIFDSEPSYGILPVGQHWLNITHDGVDGQQAVDIARFEVQGEEILEAVGFNTLPTPSTALTPDAPSSSVDTVQTPTTDIARSTGDVTAEVAATGSPGGDEAIFPATAAVEIASNVEEFDTATAAIGNIVRSDGSSVPTAKSEIPPVSQATKQEMENTAAANAQQMGETKVGDQFSPTLIIGLAAGLGGGALLFVAFTLFLRSCLRKRREGRTLRWSKERGLRYSWDFECAGPMPDAPFVIMVPDRPSRPTSTYRQMQQNARATYQQDTRRPPLIRQPEMLQPHFMRPLSLNSMQTYRTGQSMGNFRTPTAIQRVPVPNMQTRRMQNRDHSQPSHLDEISARLHRQASAASTSNSSILGRAI